MGIFDRLRRQKTTESWKLVHRVRAERGVEYYWLSSGSVERPLDNAEARAVAPGADRLLAADLELLRDEGMLEDGVVPFEVIANLEEDGDLARLRLEVSRGWQAETRPKGRVGVCAPNVVIHWRAPDGAFFAGLEDERFVAVACGFWDVEESRLHILPPAMLRMRELIAKQPARFGKVSQEYGFLQQVQELAEEGTELSEQGVLRLDDQLQREKYVVPRPEDVQVEVRRTEEGGLALSPTMPGHESFEAGQQLLQTPPAPTAFRQTGADGAGRERIAYDEAVLERIEVIRAAASVAPEEVEEFVRDPAMWVADRAATASPRLGEVAAEMDFGRTAERVVELDLSSFGPRVAGEVEYVAGPSYEARVVESQLQGELLGPMVRPTAVPEPVEEESAERSRRGQTILEVVENLDEVQFAARASEALRSQLQEFPTPESFQGSLRAHQREGYVWLRNLWSAAQNEESGQGGLLADEMGLGKTVQVAALLAHLREAGELRPAAVVAPSTVTQNWPEELRRFVGPNLRVLDHSGSARTRDPRVIAQHDVVIVSYDTLVRDQMLFAKIPFKVLVLDEAHYIKNQGVKRSRACRAMQADLRLALTATPVENRLEELWAVVEFVQPGLLGSLREFGRTTVHPIDVGGEIGARASQRLLEKLGPHYLRRTKRQVIDLPPKTVTTVQLAMTPEQRTAYQAVRDHHRAAGKGSLAAIHDLVRVSAHPAAVAELSGELGLDGMVAELASSPEAFVQASPKFRFVMDKLKEIRERGEKAVIFTSVRAVQPLVQMAVHDAFGFRPLALNGEHAARARFREIERFNSADGFDVLVLSAQAVGLGVNITAANHVFHLTREWNPSKEAQATDRVHRIGQTKPVSVWIPIVADPDMLCIDARIEELMQQKGALTDSVIRPSASLNFSEQDLAVVLEDLPKAAAEREAVRLQVVEAQERETMRHLVQEPVAVDPAPTQRITVSRLTARSILDHPRIAPKVVGTAASERGLLVLESLLSKRRIHVREIARDADMNLRRLGSVLSMLKSALNQGDMAVLASDDEYYHLRLDALERVYGVRAFGD